MNDSIFSSFGPIIILLVVLFVIFLVIRELMCWYWKINQGIELLTEIRDLLANQSAFRREPTIQSSDLPPLAASVPTSTNSLGTCPNCSAEIPLSSKACPKCKASFEEGSTWRVEPQ